MISEDSDYSDIECALSNDFIKHIVYNPLSLTCKHNICQKCLLDPRKLIQCKICGQLNHVDLSNAVISNETQIRVRENIHSLLIRLEKQIISSIDDLKSKKFPLIQCLI